MKPFMTARLGIVAAAVVALVWAFSPPVQQGRAATTKTPWRHLTASELSAVWWQWVYSVPVTDSPVFDDTGDDAYNGQPYADLLFLGGTYSNTVQDGNVLGEVTRSISAKQGTTFFFPLINTEWDHVGVTPHLGGTTPVKGVLAIPELRAGAAASVDGTFGLYATLTPSDKNFEEATGPSQDLGYSRLQSPVFQFKLPATDNLYQLFGFDISGTVAPAVGDGFYSSIPGTLAPGYYVLEFGGEIVINDAGNTFTEAITYHITVTK